MPFDIARNINEEFGSGHELTWATFALRRPGTISRFASGFLWFIEDVVLCAASHGKILNIQDLRRKASEVANLASEAQQRIFVSGATGFIGAHFLRAAVTVGHQVDALTRSKDCAASLSSLGATAIVGDLSDAEGVWREALMNADAVVHLAQPQTFGGRLTKARARQYCVRRLKMDRVLFHAIDPAKTRRIIYVAGTSYYGECGSMVCDEGGVPHPMGWGPYLAPAIESLPGYVARGLPIVAAFPGWVYGPGSWFAQYVLEPLFAGKPVYGLRGRAKYTSPVHVDDCARALLHLIDHGEVGSRYFIVDDAPVPSERLAELAAEALGVNGRGRKLPFAMLKLLSGQVVAESLAYENRLSNNRLRSTGFSFKYPSCEQGVPQAVGMWLKEAASAQQSTNPTISDRNDV